MASAIRSQPAVGWARRRRPVGEQPRRGTGWCARSRPIVVAAPWPGSTTRVVGQREHLVAPGWSSICSCDPPGRSVRPIEPANSTSPESSARRALAPAPSRRLPEHHRARGCGPGRGPPRASSPASSSTAPSVSSRDVVRLGATAAGRRRTAPGLAPTGPASGRRAAPRSSGWILGRDALGAAHRRHREDVVDVAVGEQHGDRAAAGARRARSSRSADHLDAGVDDDALLARPGGQDVAVGARRRRRGSRRRAPGHSNGGVGVGGCGPAPRVPTTAARSEPAAAGGGPSTRMCRLTAPRHWHGSHAPAPTHRRCTIEGTHVASKEPRAPARPGALRAPAGAPRRRRGQAPPAHASSPRSSPRRSSSWPAPCGWGVSRGDDAGRPRPRRPPRRRPRRPRRPPRRSTAPRPRPPQPEPSSTPRPRSRSSPRRHPHVRRHARDQLRQHQDRARRGRRRRPSTPSSCAPTQGYYNDTPCHRLTTEGIFVLQCGDPTGNGQGGPGYQIPDENLPEDGPDNYPRGTVAMAERAARTPTAASSSSCTRHHPAAELHDLRQDHRGSRRRPERRGPGRRGRRGRRSPAQPIGILKALTYESFPAG